MFPSKWTQQEPDGWSNISGSLGSGASLEDQFDLSQKIATNLVLYCHNAVSSGGMVAYLSPGNISGNYYFTFL